MIRASFAAAATVAAGALGAYFVWPSSDAPVPAAARTSAAAPVTPPAAPPAGEQSWLAGTPMAGPAPPSPPLPHAWKQDVPAADKAVVVRRVEEVVRGDPQLRREIDKVELKDDMIVLTGRLGHGSGSEYPAGRIMELFGGTPGVTFMFEVRLSDADFAQQR